MITQLPSSRLTSLNCFHHGRNRILFFINRYLLCIQVCLSSMQKHIHPWVSTMPYFPFWYSTGHCFWSRNSLHRKRNVAMGPCSENSYYDFLEKSYYAPHYTEAAVLLGVKVFWRLSHCQLGSNTLQGSGEVLKAVECIPWTSIQYMVLFLPDPGFMGPGIKGRKWKWYHSVLTLVIH